MRPVRRNPESTAHNHCIEYEWTDSCGHKKSGRWSELCSSACQALAHFHTFVQHHGEVDAERKPIRPKLGPDQYRITRLYISFPSETVRNAWEEQDIEIPAGANPDNRRGRHTPPPPTVLFPFMDELPKGKMPAEQPVIVIPD